LLKQDKERWDYWWIIPYVESPLHAINS